MGIPAGRAQAEQVLADRQTLRDNNSELCSLLCPLACGPTKTVARLCSMTQSRACTRPALKPQSRDHRTSAPACCPGRVHGDGTARRACSSAGRTAVRGSTCRCEYRWCRPFSDSASDSRQSGPAAAAGLASAPDARSDGSLGTAPPQPHVEPPAQGLGEGGGDGVGGGHMCILSATARHKLQNSELRDQTAAGGSPPRRPDTSQDRLSTNPLRPPALLLKACRQLGGSCAGGQSEEINIPSTHTLSLSP